MGKFAVAVAMLTALEEGKTIQYKLVQDKTWQNADWVDGDTVLKNFSDAEWRVKPEPEVLWKYVYRYKHGTEMVAAYTEAQIREREQKHGKGCMEGQYFVRREKFIKEVGHE